MPLITRILRDGKPLPVRWGQFHIAAMALAAAFDSGEGPYDDNSPESVIGEGYSPDNPIPISRGLAFQLASYPVLAATPLNNTQYTLTHAYTFADESDGEIFELKIGDTLIAYRQMK